MGQNSMQNNLDTFNDNGLDFGSPDPCPNNDSDNGQGFQNGANNDLPDLNSFEGQFSGTVELDESLFDFDRASCSKDPEPSSQPSHTLDEDIDPSLQNLQPATVQIPPEMTEGRGDLRTKGMPSSSRSTTWEREGSHPFPAASQHSPIEDEDDVTHNDEESGTPIQRTAEEVRRENFLQFCYGQNSEPYLHEMEKEAQYLDRDVNYVHAWYIQKRREALRNIQNSQRAVTTGSAQASDKDEANNNDESNDNNENDQPGVQLDGTNTGKANNLESLASTSNSQGSATFTGSQVPASEVSQVTPPSASSQLGKHICTHQNSPPCRDLVFAGRADWTRHETEVHWQQVLYTCLLCSIYLRQGQFSCDFCRTSSHSLEEIERHALRPCAKAEKAARHWKRKKDLKVHREKEHPDNVPAEILDGLRSESEGRDCWKCGHCGIDFEDKSHSYDHLCAEKEAQMAEKELKIAFKAKDKLPLAKLVERWNFPVTSDWPTKCIFGCEKQFQSFDERADHYHSKHFSKRGLDYLKIDNDDDNIGNDAIDQSLESSSIAPSSVSQSRSHNQSGVGGRARGGRGRGRGRRRGSAARQQTKMTPHERSREYLGPDPVEYIGTQFQGPRER